MKSNFTAPSITLSLASKSFPAFDVNSGRTSVSPSVNYCFAMSEVISFFAMVFHTTNEQPFFQLEQP